METRPYKGGGQFYEPILSMKNEIILNKSGNIFCGSIAIAIAATTSITMNNVEYALSIGHIEPAIELRPNIVGMYPKQGLMWGTKAFLASVESGEIKLNRNVAFK